MRGSSVMKNKIGHRKMKKKILCAALALTMVCSLSACAFRWGDVEDEVNEALTEEDEQGNESGSVTGRVQESIPEPEANTSNMTKTELEVAAALEDPELDEMINAEMNPDEVEAPDESVMTDTALDTVSMEASGADESGNTETSIKTVKKDTLQIVFMGDSIFDSVRDETGIAYIVGDTLHADIYNLSIGGTTAGLTRNKSTDLATWNEPSFNGVLYAMEGRVDRGILAGYKAGEVMATLDPTKTDYFVIEYGTNDFLSYIPTGAVDTTGQYYFYYSTALTVGIRELQRSYPDAQIILCTPYYEQFWSADRTRYIGDVHTVNNGYGTQLGYIGSMQSVAEERGVTCLNMYDLLAIDTYTVDKMTEDGIHPNGECRRTYAGFIADKIWELEMEKRAEAGTQ